MILELVFGDSAGLVVGHQAVKGLIVTLDGHIGGCRLTVHGRGFRAKLAVVLGQELLIVRALLFLAVDIAGHAAGRSAHSRAGHGAFDIAGGQAADNGAEKAACYGAGRCRARHRVFVFPELLDRPVALGIVVHLGHRAAIAACAAGQGESHREKGGTAYGRESGFHTTLRIKFAARAYGLSENGRSRTSDFGKFSTAVPERQEDGFSFPWRRWSSPGRVRYADPRLIRQGSTAAL